MTFHKAIQDKETGEIIFAIPMSKDEKERAEVLKNQIVEKLVLFSNQFNSYDKAIDKVQSLLKSLIRHYPEEVKFIKRVADEAGEIYLAIVREARSRAFCEKVESMNEKILRGEMFLGVKSVKGAKNGQIIN